jgi:hypothetical protein
MPSGNLSRRRLLVARGSEEMGTLKPMVFAQTTTAEPDSPRQATSDAQSTQSDAIDEASIDQIIDLLNDDSDAVRGKVAMAIAAIGPRARRATPALEDALELARQYITFAAARNFIFSGFPIYTGPSSAHDICHAFKEIGAPEPPDCFNGYYDPVTSNNGP